MASESSEHTVVLHVTPGELLDDRWRIETRIGQGAMGSVFRGRDLESDTIVAIKLLAPEHCKKPKVLARFEREAELMTTIRHPNIVHLYGHGRRGALPYIVMEYLEGMTLSEVLEHEKGMLPLAETVAVVKQIASGLAFLHHYGLVHRDVKPQNIFLAAGGRVCILDLGVVRDQANPGLTRPGAMVGTPYYMSPEQIQGLEDVDRRTDVYALAAMTFELLTGRPPFLGANNFEVLYGHRNTPPPDAAQLVKTVSKGVAQVLMRSLAKKREERPETASEFAADLEAAAGPKRVDLAKSFSFVLERTRAKSKKAKAAARRPARKPTDEVPMAAAEDVVSVHTPLPQGLSAISSVLQAVIDSDAAKTQLVASAAVTQVGASATDLPRVPFRDTGEETNSTHLPADAPVEGQLKVVVTAAKGRVVSGTVTIDKTPFGPSSKTFWVAPGMHVVRVTANGFRAVERLVEVVAGNVTTLRVELQAA